MVCLRVFCPSPVNSAVIRPKYMTNHRAFAFNWESFDTSLRPMLEYALTNSSRDILVDFVDRNRDRLVDPYDGLPLPPSWQLLMENPNDIHTIGDFCLTRFYDPKRDHGISERFETVSALLSDNEVRCLCGHVLGSKVSPFDPVGMGCYFQKPRAVVESRRTLAQHRDQLAGFLNFLDDCISDGLGLYVTL